MSLYGKTLLKRYMFYKVEETSHQTTKKEPCERNVHRVLFVPKAGLEL